MFGVGRVSVAKGEKVDMNVFWPLNCLLQGTEILGSTKGVDALVFLFCGLISLSCRRYRVLR